MKTLKSDNPLTVTDADTGEEIKLSSGLAIPMIQMDKNKGMWENIDSFIEDYKALYPEDYKLFIQQTEVVRETRKNQYASSKDNTLRWGFSIPTNLALTIKKYYPELYSNKKNYNLFMRRYPEFRICNVV